MSPGQADGQEGEELSGVAVSSKADGMGPGKVGAAWSSCSEE